MRKFDRALNILKGHVAAVMSVEFSPTGEELVTGSYDRTIRLFQRDKGHSRDIYHLKRMQRVFSTTWTPDSKYILSGSDDGKKMLLQLCVSLLISLKVIFVCGVPMPRRERVSRLHGNGRLRSIMKG